MMTDNLTNMERTNLIYMQSLVQRFNLHAVNEEDQEYADVVDVKILDVTKKSAGIIISRQ